MNPVLVSLLLAAPGAAPAAPPRTRVQAISDTYHGVVVPDPYRWLEDGGAPEVQAWSRAQDGRTREWLAGRPGMEALRARVREVVTARTASYGAFRV